MDAIQPIDILMLITVIGLWYNDKSFEVGKYSKDASTAVTKGMQSGEILPIIAVANSILMPITTGHRSLNSYYRINCANDCNYGSINRNSIFMMTVLQYQTQQFFRQWLQGQIILIMLKHRYLIEYIKFRNYYNAN